LKPITTRREFLGHSAAILAVSSLPAVVRGQSPSTAAALTLSVNAAVKSATVPMNFTGLSYESAQLGHPEFFSAQNAALIALVRRLGPQGVLRIGGNTSDYTRWSPDDADTARNNTSSAINPDAGTAAKTASIITPQAIRNLNDFMVATGWQLIYGLDLRRGTPENAAAEATFVAKTLGSRLLAFQIGNEPDMNHNDGEKQRWTFDQYWSQFVIFRDAIRKAVPNAPFAGPDIAKELDWITNMANHKPDLVMLTGHYYAEGPPKDPAMTLEFLLKRGRNPESGEIATVHKATQMLGKPYRMSEGNSCFHGGKPGVSDTFASALWSADYMLQLAQAGYIGVNLHGGGEGLYTPIAGSIENGFTARPVYYGMLLAQDFVGCTLVEAKLGGQTSAANVTAFAATQGKQYKLAVFNKSSLLVSVAIDGLAASIHSAAVSLLQAPAIDSKDGVTFGGSAVSKDGSFTPRSQSTLSLRHGKASLDLPPYTAALITT